MTKMLQTYHPLRDFFSLGDELSGLVWGLGNAPRESDAQNPAAWIPAVDVSEDAEAFRIHAELPGLKKEDVKIRVHDGVLTVQGERKFSEEQRKDSYYRRERSYGFFARSFTLPKTVDPEKVQAKMRDGVLELNIPKRPESKPKEVQVEIG